MQRVDSGGAQFAGHDGAALKSQKGGFEQTVVEHGHLLLFLGIAYQLECQLFEQARQRQHDEQAGQLKAGIDGGDGYRVNILLRQEGGLEDGVEEGEEREVDDGADDVEGQMHHGGALGVLVSTRRGDHSGDAGADVLAHDDRNGRTVGDGARSGQSLQDTDRGRAGLDDAGEHGTDQHTEQRVFKGHKELLEGGVAGKAFHGTRHSFHTEHQRGKAEQDGACVLALAVFEEHVHDDADEGKDGGEGGGLEELDPAGTVDGAHTDDPGRDGRAQVGAEDDVGGLAQRHEPRVDKADHHDGGGGGALDDGGDAEAG